MQKPNKHTGGIIPFGVLVVQESEKMVLLYSTSIAIQHTPFLCSFQHFEKSLLIDNELFQCVIVHYSLLPTPITHYKS